MGGPAAPSSLGGSGDFPPRSANGVPVIATVLSAEEKQRRAERARAIHEARATTAVMGSGPPTPVANGYHVSMARKRSPLPVVLAAPPQQSASAPRPAPRRRNSTKSQPIDVPQTTASGSETDDGDAVQVKLTQTQRSDPPPPLAEATSADATSSVPRAQQSFEISDSETSDSDGEANVQKPPKAGQNSKCAESASLDVVDLEVVVPRRVGSDEGFGFEVAEAEDRSVTVSSVSADVQDDNTLQVGDCICAIDGENVAGMEFADISQKITNGGDELRVQVRRKTAREVPLIGVLAPGITVDDSSDEEPTLMPPPVFANAPRFGDKGDEEAALPLAKGGGKFSAAGHAEAVRAMGATGSKAETRMMTLTCLLGVIVILLCVFMLLATSSDAQLVESFHFGSITSSVSNASDTDQAIFGLRFVRLRTDDTRATNVVKYDSAVCSGASPILNSHKCTQCKDAGSWVARTLAILLVLNVVRLDIVSPRRTAKGNLLFRRILSVLLSLACFVGDVMLIYAFREDCLLQWQHDETVTSTYGPGVVLGAFTVILDAISLFVNCAIPHAYIPIK